jgi:DNA-binding PucR family transcriptional regulator
MRGLAEIFPGCNMVVYGGAVMVLISFDERNLHLSFDRPRLSELLESHDACMGISNASRNRAMLRTLAMQCRSTLRLARVLRASTENRIFLHEDYSIYNIIDLCARSFKEEYHHDDLLYLIHPCIVQLARYDLKNSSNLVEVLYHYLVSGCNLVKTARALYMHRNTVLNKVNKAIDIIGRSLEDGEFQQRLMFSTQLLRYFERYLGKDVILN